MMDMRRSWVDCWAAGRLNPGGGPPLGHGVSAHDVDQLLHLSVWKPYSQLTKHDDAGYVTHVRSGGRSWEGQAQTWVETEVVAGANAADGADSLVQRYNAAVLLLEATQAQVPLP